MGDVIHGLYAFIAKAFVIRNSTAYIGFAKLIIFDDICSFYLIRK